MTHDTSSTAIRPFIWAVGIEDTNVGWPLPGAPEGLDEYAVTGHYQQWRDDLRLAASVGATTIRYGFPWYRIEAEPGRFNWTWTDAVVEYAEQLGLDMIVDLVHYGTPRWLTGSFTDPSYPDAVAAWAGAVAARYRGRFSSITPLNEPLVTASFVGMRGVWPPHETGELGWARVVVSVAEGIQRSIAAIRAADPLMQIVHVEATHVWATQDEQLTADLQLLEAKNWLPTDLVMGRVIEAHPLHEWLQVQGIGADRLQAVAAAAEQPDIIGVNYYPELSARKLAMHDGRVVGVTFNGWSSGLDVIVRSFHARYDRPILVSETAVEGSDDHRTRWLDSAVSLLLRLRTEGIPIVGMVWWPLFDFVDWSWATGEQVIEEFYSVIDGIVSPILPPTRGAGLDAYFRRMGLYRLEVDDEIIGRVPTAAADAFHRHATALPVHQTPQATTTSSSIIPARKSG